VGSSRVPAPILVHAVKGVERGVYLRLLAVEGQGGAPSPRVTIRLPGKFRRGREALGELVERGGNDLPREESPRLPTTRRTARRFGGLIQPTRALVAASKK
jgi:hypothetical protein